MSVIGGDFFGAQVGTKIESLYRRRIEEAGGRLERTALRLTQIPLEIFGRVTDGIIGSLYTVLSTLTLGNLKGAKKLGTAGLNSAGDTLARTHRTVILLFNSEAKLEFPASDKRSHGGLLTRIVVDRMELLAFNLNESKSFIGRHLATRAIYMAMIPTAIVLRVADLAIGVLAALASLFTGGRIEKLNTIAYWGLQGLRLTADVTHAVQGVINPRAGMPSRKYWVLPDPIPQGDVVVAATLR